MPPAFVDMELPNVVVYAVIFISSVRLTQMYDPRAVSYPALTRVRPT